MPLPLVWTERETDDWEACVIAAYLMGLLYGGASIPNPYTQAEREALEVVPDAPQDFDTTDVRAQARYGLHLRRLSTGSIDDAVTRVGVGLVMAGYGGLLIPTAAPIHAVFYVPATPIAGWLLDPLAADRSAPVSIAAARMVAWSKGAGPNDAREVREGEFAPDMDITITRYPAPRPWTTRGGPLTGYRLDPAPLTYTDVYDAGSPASALAEYVITPTPAGWPDGPYQLIGDGGHAGYLVADAQINLGPIPSPAGGVTQADVAAAIAAAVEPLEARLDAIARAAAGGRG